MKREAFDEELRRKFGEQEFNPDPESWGRLSASLPEKSSRRLRPFFPVSRKWLAAASLLFCFSLGWSIYEYALKPAPSPLVSRQDDLADPGSQPSGNTPLSSPDQDSEKRLPEEEKSVVSSADKATKNTSDRRVVTLSEEGKEPAAGSNAAGPVREEPVQNEMPPSQQSTASAPPSPDMPVNPIPRQVPPNINILEGPFVSLEAPPRQGKTYIHLTGGWNYGSLNAGYMAGVNARQRLTGKLYIEGDLAYTHGKANQASVLSVAHYQAVSKGGAVPGAFSNTVMQHSKDFNYLQFNPSIGYAIVPKWTVSVGADLQQILENTRETRTLIFIDNEARLLPDLDVGITGRTEYALSRRFRAGVVYRQGVNNLVRGGQEYFDRRYLQVQIKWRVFAR